MSVVLIRMLIRQGEARRVVVFPLTDRMDTSLLALLTVSLLVSTSWQTDQFPDCHSCLVFGPSGYRWCLEQKVDGKLAKGCISNTTECKYWYEDTSENDETENVNEGK